MDSCLLIIDTREKNVTRHAIELADTRHEIKQITTGDYAIISPAGQLLVVIERKTLEDFAASLKDGRHANKAKLADMRLATGCRIVYIIEGPAFPAPTDTFGEMPYHHIESSIFHLMVRDCVTVLRSENTLHTAQILARFIKSMNTLYLKHGMREEPAPLLIGHQEGDPQATTRLLTAPVVKSDNDIVREMWSSFTGISVESADEYMKHWTIADIVQEKIPRATMMDFKMANGRRVNKRIVNALTAVGRPLEIRLLAKIPGISTQSATTLVTAMPLSRLLMLPDAELSALVIGKAGRKLGEKSAKNILKYFNFKYEVAPPAPPAEPALGFTDEDVVQIQSLVNML